MKKKTVPYKYATPKLLQMRGFLMLGALVAQFVVGMALDLFVKLPEAHPVSGDIQGYFWALTNGGGAALTTHVVIATILLLGSIATLSFSIVARSKAWIVASSFGFLGVLAGFLNGLEFINNDLDKHSMAMAMGFIIALVSYGLGVYFGKRKV